MIDFEEANRINTDETISQLLRTFYNHVFVGQWELARGFALTLSTYEKAKPLLLDALRYIIRNPQAISLDLPAGTSPTQKSHLACCLLQEVAGEQLLQEDAAEMVRVELDLGLQDLFSEEPQVVQEMRELHAHTRQSLSTQVQQDVVRKLVDAPAHAVAVLEQLCGHHLLLIDVAMMALEQTDGEELLRLLSALPESMEPAVGPGHLSRLLGLPQAEVYGALAARPSPLLLQAFCDLQDRTSRLSLVEHHALDLAQLVAFSLRQRKHFLLPLLEHVVQLVVQGADHPAWLMTRHPLLQPLRPLVLLQAWAQDKDGNVVSAMRRWLPNIECQDPVLRDLCHKWQFNLNFSEWIASTLSQMKLPLPPFHQRTLLTQLQKLSPLCALHSLLPLPSLPPQEVLAALDTSLIQPQGQYTAAVLAHNRMVYKAYLTLTAAMKGLHASHRLELAVRGQLLQGGVEQELLAARGLQEAYHQLVFCQLQTAQQLCGQLQPPSLRLDILENLFSLLFLTAADYYDADGGGVPEDYQASTEDLSEHQRVDSSRTSGSSSAASASPSPHFLSNEFFIRDLISTVHQPLNALLQQLNPTQASLLQRTQRLLTHVSQAQWRYELVVNPAVVQEPGWCQHLPLLVSEAPQEDRKPARPRRRRHRRAGCPCLPTLLGVVHQMLASPDHLLVTCLARGQLGKAAQVVEFFKMENHPLAQEVVFAEEMMHFRKQVGTLTTQRGNHTNGHVSQIVQVASDSWELFCSHSALEEMLRKLHVPEYSGQELKFREAMVLVDLATTTPDLPAHTAAFLLKFAGLRLGDSQLDQMKAFVKHLQDLSHKLIPGQSLAKALTLGLASHEAQAQAEVWPQLADALSNFRSALADKSQELRLSHASQHPPHMHFQSLIRLASKLTAPVSRPLNYLQALFDRLKYVTTALLQCRIQSQSLEVQPYSSYFGVIAESPADILRKMILQENISPCQLEPFAGSMRLNLVHILAISFFPAIPALPAPPSSIYSSRNVAAGLHPTCLLQLNHFPGRSWTDPRTPDLVAESLLNSVVSLIKAQGKERISMEDLRRLVAQRRSEVERWMEETSELAAVDLNLTQEPVGLWSNVGMVAWLHGLLYPLVLELSSTGLASPHLTERLVHHCLLGYRVGQAGLLSLADLRYCVLRWGAPSLASVRHSPVFTFLLDLTKTQLEAVQTYFPKFEPRLHFVLTDGFGHSPKLQVLHTESLQIDLANATADYLSHHVTIGQEVRVPQVLMDNVEDFVTLADNLQLVEPLKSCLEPLLPASQGQKSGAKHRAVDVVVLEPETLEFCLVLEYGDLPGADSGPAPAQMPIPVEEFLAERSPLALTLVGLEQRNSESSLPDSGLGRWLTLCSGDLQASLAPRLPDHFLWSQLELAGNLELLWLAEEQLGPRPEFLLLRDAVLGSSGRPLAISAPILRTPHILSNLSQCDFPQALVHLQACDPVLAAPALAHLQLFHQIAEAVRPEVGGWYAVAEMPPAEVVELMERHGLGELAETWGRLMAPLPVECRPALWRLQLTWQLGTGIASLEKLLSCEPPDFCRELCLALLQELAELQPRILLAWFLHSHSDQLSLDSPDYFLSLALRFKIFLESSLSRYHSLEDLGTSPLDLLQALIIRQEMEQLGRILQMPLVEGAPPVAELLPRSAFNSLLEEFAEIALEFPCQAPSECTVQEDEPLPRQQWIPDYEVQVCQACNSQRFTMIYRRHHCRQCGRVVCGTCSKHVMPVHGYDQPVRVCFQCYHKAFRLDDNGLPTPPFARNRLRSMSTGGGASPGGPLFLPSPSLVVQTDKFLAAQTPSISLCLAILRLHSEPHQCGNFLRQQAQRLLRVVRSSRANNEVDCSLVLHMVELLLVNAKLRYQDAGQTDEVNHTDTVLRHLDILRLLANNNCLHLLPAEDLVLPRTFSKLVEQLALEERWPIALEVATKSGLPAGPVWVAWAMVSLRAGHWQLARTRFARILKEPKDRNNPRDQSPLLTEILAVLQHSALVPPSQGSARAGGGCKYPGSKKNSESIHQALEELVHIRAHGCKALQQKEVAGEQRYEECVYYLRCYGSHQANLKFFLSHNRLDHAVNYLLDQGCEAAMFVAEVLGPCLETGRAEALLAQLEGPEHRSLVTWACRHLSQAGLLYPLLQLQIFMRDFVRAAMTCVHLFCMPLRGNLEQQGHRLNLLVDARAHLNTHLQLLAYREQPSHLSIAEIRGHLATIQLQEEVVQFLFHNSNIPSPTLPPDLQELPTLFGNLQERTQLVCLIAISGYTVEAGFHLIAKIIRLFGLSWETVAGEVGQRLVGAGRHEELSNLLGCLQPHCPHLEPDTILLQAMQSPEISEEVLAKVLQMVRKTSNKVILCAKVGRIKKAFLLIKFIRSLPELQKVQEFVTSRNLHQLQNMCDHVYKKLIGQDNGSDTEES